MEMNDKTCCAREPISQLVSKMLAETVERTNHVATRTYDKLRPICIEAPAPTNQIAPKPGDSQQTWPPYWDKTWPPYWDEIRSYCQAIRNALDRIDDTLSRTEL